MVTLWLTIIIFFLVIHYIQFKLRRRKFEEMIEKFAGPPAIPVLGNLQIFLATSKEMLRKVGRLVQQYGSPFRVWILHKPIVLVFDPENFQIVLSKTTEKAESYHFMHTLLGEGLITINGSKWKQHRRILNPAFNVILMNTYFLNIFNDFNAVLVKILSQVEPETEIDLWPYIFKCTRDIICMTAMGYQDNTANDMEHRRQVIEYGQNLERASSLVTERFWKPWLHPEIFFHLYNRITGNYKILEEIRRLPLNIIKQKKEELKCAANPEDNLNEYLKEKKLKNFIDILLNSDVFKDLPEEKLVDEIVTFILAGSESSAITVCFTLLMLAMNPEVQKNVHDELDKIFGSGDRMIEIEDLNQLTILECCIKETLRRFAPAPMILRKIDKDIELKNGLVLPADATVLLPIILLHLCEDVYTDPYKWDPNRFLLENIEKRNPPSFIPFSSGLRACIGAKYGIMAIKTQLCTILRKYQFYTNMKMNDIKLGFDIVLRNHSGYRVYLKRR